MIYLAFPGYAFPVYTFPVYAFPAINNGGSGGTSSSTSGFASRMLLTGVL